MTLDLNWLSFRRICRFFLNKGNQIGSILGFLESRKYHWGAYVYTFLYRNLLFLSLKTNLFTVSVNSYCTASIIMQMHTDNYLHSHFVYWVRKWNLFFNKSLVLMVLMKEHTWNVFLGILQVVKKCFTWPHNTLNTCILVSCQ